MSVWDIQVFIGFANFYRHFIKGSSRIIAWLTAILKTTGSFVASASKVDDDEVVGGRSAISRLDVSRKSAKSKNRTKSGNYLEESKFLTSKAKETFNRLKQAFTKALILQHFDPECHIRIETNALGYAIERVLSQLTQNQMISDEAIGSNTNWYSVAYFSKKMIFAETRYKTHNSELLAIRHGDIT